MHLNRKNVTHIRIKYSAREGPALTLTTQGSGIQMESCVGKKRAKLRQKKETECVRKSGKVQMNLKQKYRIL